MSKNYMLKLTKEMKMHPYHYNKIKSLKLKEARKHFSKVVKLFVKYHSLQKGGEKDEIPDNLETISVNLKNISNLSETKMNELDEKILELEKGDNISKKKIKELKENKKNISKNAIKNLDFLIEYRNFLESYRKYFNYFHEIYDRYVILKANKEKFRQILKKNTDKIGDMLKTYNEFIFSNSKQFGIFINNFINFINFYEKKNKELNLINLDNKYNITEVSVPNKIDNLKKEFIEELDKLEKNFNIKMLSQIIEEELNIINHCHCTTQCKYEQTKGYNHWCFVNGKKCTRGNYKTARGLTKTCNPDKNHLGTQITLNHEKQQLVGSSENRFTDFAHKTNRKIICVNRENNYFFPGHDCGSDNMVELDKYFSNRKKFHKTISKKFITDLYDKIQKRSVTDIKYLSDIVEEPNPKSKPGVVKKKK